MIEKIGFMLNKLRAYAVWGFPAKLLLQALGAIAGAGILGFLSNYATYYYALSLGVRPPLEGVPYLSTAVAFLSLVMLLTGALLFVATYSAFSFILSTPQRAAAIILRLFGYESHEKDLARGPFDGLRSQSFLRRVLAMLAIGAVGISLHAILVYFFDRDWGELVIPGVKLTRDWGLFICVAWTLVLSAILVFPSTKWPLSVLFTLGYFLFAIALLFSPNHYAEFLRHVGYGGGLPITLYTKDSDLQKYINDTEISLVLRTNDTMIVFAKKEQRFLEIPRDEVIYFTYRTGGLGRASGMLPGLLDSRR